jgi:MFS family permease
MADTAASGIPAQTENGAAVTTAEQKLGLRTTLRALKHRNFQLFFSGQFISLVGTWMQSVAQDWLVYRLTGSAWLMSLVAFAGQIPVLLISPAAGIVADRRNRQYTVIATQTFSMLIALILATLTLLRVVKVWEIVILATSLGIVNAFDVPARQSFLIEMVGREDLLNAIALNSAMYNGARVIGPAIAGILIAGIGEGWCFFANGVSYIAVIVGLFMMRVSPRELQSNGSAFENIIEGFRFVRHTSPVRAILLMVGLVSLTTMPVMVLMPIFADRILHGGARGLGWLMGAAGVGALLGGLTLASRRGVKGLGRWIWVAATAVGASLILFAASRHFWLSVGVLGVAGFGMLVQMGSCNTLVQVMVPDRLRGRVMSVYSMMLIGIGPIGALIAGRLAVWIGAPWTVAICGAMALLGAAAFAWHLPTLRGPARELISQQGLGLPQAPVPFPRS